MGKGKRIKNAKYTIKAKDLPSLRKALARSNAEKYCQKELCCPTKNGEKLGIDEWAIFCWEFCLDYETRDDSVVTRIDVTPCFKIFMPVWKNYRDQPQKIKNRWDEMYRNLKKHEIKHSQILLNGANKFIRELKNKETLTGKELEDLFQKASETIVKQQKEYDRRTDNGISEGVKI